MLYGLAPNYLIELISIKKQSKYSLRSNESLLLELPSTKTLPTLGDRAFQSAAPNRCAVKRRLRESGARLAKQGGREGGREGGGEKNILIL